MTRTDWTLLFALSILWGGSFLFVEVALQGLPALTIVLGRVAIAAFILGGVMVLRGQSLPRRAWGAVLVMGFLNNVIPFTLFVLAQGSIDGSLAAIVNATTPLWTVIVAHVFTTDERITPPKAAGLVFGFVGVVVMTGGAGGGERLAIVGCLGAAMSYGFAGVWGRRFRHMGVPPLATAFGTVTSSSLIMLPLVLMVDQPWALPWPGQGALLAVLALAALSTALAYLIYFRLLASAGATNLSLVTFLIPVSAVAMGVAFLNETVRPGHLAGFALIVAGLLAMDGRIARWARSKRAAQ